jgi:S1-C subfamily serine protease
LGGGLNLNDPLIQGLMKQGLAGLNNPNGDGLKDLLGALQGLKGIEAFGAELGLPEFAPNNNPRAFPQFPGIDRPRLGIRLERLSPVVVEQLGLEKGQGVTIAAVVDGTPAAKAGLKVHDIVLELSGKPVSDDPTDFVRRLNEVNGKAKVDLVVLRKGKRVEIKGIELADTQPGLQPFPRMPR